MRGRARKEGKNGWMDRGREGGREERIIGERERPSATRLPRHRNGILPSHRGWLGLPSGRRTER